jgi:hypothetical protein
LVSVRISEEPAAHLQGGRLNRKVKKLEATNFCGNLNMQIKKGKSNSYINNMVVVLLERITNRSALNFICLIFKNSVPVLR